MRLLQGLLCESTVSHNVARRPKTSKNIILHVRRHLSQNTAQSMQPPRKKCSWMQYHVSQIIECTICDMILNYCVYIDDFCVNTVLINFLHTTPCSVSHPNNTMTTVYLKFNAISQIISKHVIQTLGEPASGLLSIWMPDLTSNRTVQRLISTTDSNSSKPFNGLPLMNHITGMQISKPHQI